MFNPWLACYAHSQLWLIIVSPYLAWASIIVYTVRTLSRTVGTEVFEKQKGYSVTFASEGFTLQSLQVIPSTFGAIKQVCVQCPIQ